MTTFSGSMLPPSDLTFSLNLRGTSSDSRFYGELPEGVQEAVDEIARAILDPDGGHALVIGFQNSGKSFLIEQFAGNVDHYLENSSLPALHVLEVSRADANLIETMPNGVTQYLRAVAQTLECEPENLCFVTESPDFAAALYAHSTKTKIILELNIATFLHLDQRESQGVSKIWSSWGKIDANQVTLTPEELTQSLESVMIPKMRSAGLADLSEGEIAHMVEHFLGYLPDMVYGAEAEEPDEADEDAPLYGKVIVPPGLWGVAVRRLASAIAYSSKRDHRDEEGAKDLCLIIDSTFEELQDEFKNMLEVMSGSAHEEAMSGFPFPFSIPGLPEGAELRVLSMGHSHDSDEDDSDEAGPIKFSDISTLGDRLKTTVLGQDEAVEAVVGGMVVPAAGIHDESKPVRSFLFLGPTGVGKTQLALSLGEQVAEEPLNLIRLDMSEYSQAHEAAKLLGSPAGYVGYEEGGILTNAVRKHPRSLVLLDEVEKAHHKIWDQFLQVLDAGRMTDNQGREIDFTQTIVVMTSNLGAKEASGNHSMGFFSNVNEDERVQAGVLKQVEAFFKPEFLNRIDEVVFFGPLSLETARRIVRREITLVSDRMSPRGFQLSDFEDSVVDEIIKQSSFTKYGARDIQRAVFKNVSRPVASRMLSKAETEKTISLALGGDNKIQVV